MGDRATAIRWAAIVLIVASCACAQAAQAEAAPPGNATELARHLNQSSSVRIEPARSDSRPGIALFFEGTDDLHYYAKPETAPAPGLELKAAAKSEYFSFEPPVFPKWHLFTDALDNKIEVFSGKFTIVLPMTPAKAPTPDAADVEITISGIACTSLACLSPFRQKLNISVDWTQNQSWRQITLESGVRPAAPDYSIWLALSLALLAGLVLNIMPCVLPVIPLKVLSIFEQAKQSKARCIALGLSFCLGILIFFAGIAILNIVLRLGYGTVFQWGDHFRNPVFLIAMSLLLVVLAMFMFGVFTIMVPSAIAGKAGPPRKGFAGSVAMGILAAILSTPCSFAILTTAFAWAQTQKLPLSTTAIMLIGIGMAAPYAILTSIPGLLKRLPKPGRWMELFKQSMGFVLLVVAVWLMLALPAHRLPGVVYFATILAFCVWMWGGWITLRTPKKRRRAIRITAAAIAVAAGAWLLPEPKSYIDWQPYDKTLVNKAVEDQKPVLLEFMADWCVTCKAVEKTVYSRKTIADLIKQKGVLPVKANTTLDENPATIDLESTYREPGVPVSILFVPGRSDPMRFHGLLIKKELEKALEDLPDAQERPL